MPVTTFVSMILFVILAAGVTAAAIATWGALTVLPVLMVLALLARWALSHVTLDDSHS